MSKVVAGLILNSKSEIVVSKRQKGKILEGFWEFPGGKVQKGERKLEALTREVFEETGIVIQRSYPIYSTNTKDLSLTFFLVLDFFGSPFSKEGQEIRTLTIFALKSLLMPKPNFAVINILNEIYPSIHNNY